MKKTKIIVPALGMLLLSTAASVTGTVAWFAVNTSVSVTGLKVQAKVEGGIVIAPYSMTGSSGGASITDATFAAPADNAFGNTCAMAMANAVSLLPTSTSNASNWWHNTSDSVNSHVGTGGYEALTLQKDGKHYQLNNTTYESDGQYFLYSQYKVKSTNADTFSLYVSGISVSADTNTAYLNKSVRVAVKVGGAAAVFFAPKYAADDATVLKWYVSGETPSNATVVKGTAMNTDTEPSPQVAANTINLAGLDMGIWIFYEGEDENCKTINANDNTVDALTVDVTFSTSLPAAPQNP